MGKFKSNENPQALLESWLLENGSHKKSQQATVPMSSFNKLDPKEFSSPKSEHSPKQNIKTTPLQKSENPNDLLKAWLESHQITKADKFKNHKENKATQPFKKLDKMDFRAAAKQKFFSHEKDTFDNYLNNKPVRDKDKELRENYVYRYPIGKDMTVKINRSLDLHHCTVSEALTLCKAFIIKAFEERVLVVRIIHGKGKHSYGNYSVIKEAILHWLKGEGKSYCYYVSHASRRHGGEGATLVWIS